MNFSFLAHGAFAFPTKKSFSQFMRLLASLMFSPHPTKEGTEQEAGCVLAANQGQPPAK